MGLKKIPKKLKSPKKLLIPIITVILLILFIMYHLSPRSFFKYWIPEGIKVSPSKEKYLPNQTVEVNFLLRPEEARGNFFKPIIESKLVLSTELVDPSIYLLRGGKRYGPDRKEVNKHRSPAIHVFYFHLPIGDENIQMNVTLKGKIPKIYDKRASFVQVVQRSFYLFDRKDLWIGGKRKIVG